MTKKYLISGVHWCTEVTLEGIEDLTAEQIYLEAATRGVEAFLERRFDIPLDYHEPFHITDFPSNDNPVFNNLIELINDEIHPGCGIGAFLLIINAEDHKDTVFVSSKMILENVGAPDLINRFNEKYPTEIKKS